MNPQSNQTGAQGSCSHSRPVAPVGPAILLLALLATACGLDPAAGAKARGEGKANGNGQEDKRPPLVRVEKATIRKIRREIETTGYLEAEHKVMVLSKIAGRIVEVLVDEGQEVGKGQVLASLDSREVESSRRQLEIQLAEKKVRHQLLQLEVEASERREQQASIERERTTADHRRLKELDPGLVSPKDLEDAGYAMETAIEACQVAQFNTRKAKLDVESAHQAIDEAKAKLEEVGIRLTEHKILSPLAGVVVERKVRGGETISSATELFLVVDKSNLIAYLDRPQRELPLVEKAHLVLFETDAQPGRKFTADVDLVGAVVDRSTGTFKLRIRVRRDDSAALRPGLFIRARILTEADREAIMVPKTALLAEGEDSVLFILRNPSGNIGQARKVILQPGLEDDTHAECRNKGSSGLLPGDLIIVSGHADLKDQDEVEIGTK